MPIDLGDNLVLRFARPDNADALVDFNTHTFDDRVTDWTRDLISGQHPTVQARDFTVVEDTHTNRIVSSLCLISQTWAYRNIPFRVGRFELVATDPSYRRRGLIRKQFEVGHALSATKGELMQVITGVDWFYRQFGYEMGMQLRGSWCIDAVHLRKLKEGERDECRLREAGPDDYAFIRDTYADATRGQLFAALRRAKEWDYEFNGRSKTNTRRRGWLILESAEGERVGYVQYLPCLASPHWPMFRIYQIEIKAGVGYLNLVPGVLRGLWSKAQAMVANGELPCDELGGLELALERDHLFYRALGKDLVQEIKASPWYIRVPDLVALLRKIRPALEQHLVGTVAEAYSGELRLNFFRGGMRLKFEQGQITAIESWFPGKVSEGDARLPDSAFVQLVCGWRRFGNLAETFAECSGTHEAVVLLDSLFPPFNGKVWVLS